MLNIHLKSDCATCVIAKRDFGGARDIELVLLPSEHPVLRSVVRPVVGPVGRPVVRPMRRPDIGAMVAAK